MKRLATLLILTCLAGLAVAADLEVAVREVRSASGQVKLMLFDREEGFRKEDRARQILALPTTVGTVTGLFHDLPVGRYAVIAYHDENGDGRLNLRFGMFPMEGHGLSNAPKLLGPPSFKDAAFDLQEPGKRIAISLKY